MPLVYSIFMAQLLPIRYTAIVLRQGKHKTDDTNLLDILFIIQLTSP